MKLPEIRSKLFDIAKQSQELIKQNPRLSIAILSSTIVISAILSTLIYFMSKDRRDKFLYKHEDFLLKLPIIGKKLENSITTARIRILTEASLKRNEEQKEAEEIREILRPKEKDLAAGSVENIAPKNSVSTPSSEFASTPNPTQENSSELDEKKKSMEELADKQQQQSGFNNNIKEEYAPKAISTENPTKKSKGGFRLWK